MVRFGLLLLAAVSLAGAADKKTEKYKGPEVEIRGARAHRSEGVLSVDAQVKNCGVKPIKGLTLLFDFMAPGKAVITTQKLQVDEETVEPGEERAVHVQLNDPVRAVAFRFQAIDKDTRDLRVAKPGPYPIE